jgi:hypothetical protein
MSGVTYIDAIREAQETLLREDPRVFLYGQDISNFGGAFKATKGLAEAFPNRVFDSPISEDAMIGLAVGAAIEGMRPIIEMQFADFSSIAFNQIVNQAATLYWRTNTPCPITIRLPSGGTAGSPACGGASGRCGSSASGDECVSECNRGAALCDMTWSATVSASWVSVPAKPLAATYDDDAPCVVDNDVTTDG